MIPRRIASQLLARLQQFPAVALLGPRQVGKTTLALEIAAGRSNIYLDLEASSDRDKLSDPLLYLDSHADKLVILDEVQRMPELFQSLRGIIDKGRRRGVKAGQFLLLGSASMELLRQSGESLAGRIAYVELSAFDVLEVGAQACDKLWLRGGFPDSFLAADDDASRIWRENFIRTYLERDIPQLGPRIPAETLRRLWTMLAHLQASPLNAAQLARGLGIDGKTVVRYLDLLVDLLLARRLPAFHANAGKRLVKSPKVYVRDSGIVHALLGLSDREALMGHPVVGNSWEGFVVENLLAMTGDRATACYYRTSAGAEIDLVLDLPNGERWVVEIKRSLTPSPGRGFHNARRDLEPARGFIVYPGGERYPRGENLEVIGLHELAGELAQRCAA